MFIKYSDGEIKTVIKTGEPVSEEKQKEVELLKQALKKAEEAAIKEKAK